MSYDELCIYRMDKFVFFCVSLCAVDMKRAHRPFLRDSYFSRLCFMAIEFGSASEFCRDVLVFSRNRFLKHGNGKRIDRYSPMDSQQKKVRVFSYKLRSTWSYYCVIQELKLFFSFLSEYFKKVFRVKPTHGNLNMHSKH